MASTKFCAKIAIERLIMEVSTYKVTHEAGTVKPIYFEYKYRLVYGNQVPTGYFSF
jgi:hypothetical protein